jgi:hypothetical protein
MRRDKDRLSRAWVISQRRGETLIDDIEILLGDLCKGGGFCSALPDDVLATGDPLTAEGFANAALRAEGWPEPEREYEFRPQLMKLFTERYGPAISAADYPAR